MSDELLDILLELGATMYLCREICSDSELSMQSKECSECPCWIAKDIDCKVLPPDYQKIVIKTNNESQSKSLKRYFEKRYKVDCKINMDEIVISEKEVEDNG